MTRVEDIYFTMPGCAGCAFDEDPHLGLTGLSKRQAMTLASSRKRSRKSAGSRIFTIRRCATSCKIKTSVQVVWGAKDGMTAPITARVSKGSAGRAVRSIPKAATFRISNSRPVRSGVD